ncbi:hypothetical protein BPTFM16_01357 [Altererythrobacter insulae]|nr:hypothetical protein BPTFM16_01357 [Altererythrobacter insulae]
MDGQIKTIAVVGGGMAGLTCASALKAAGLAVMVFDKGRGPGGRMAARRAEVGGVTISFDHGAQYFTAESKAFAKQIDQWHKAGVVEPWAAAGGDAWVGVPGMNGPIRYMSLENEVRWGTRVEAIDRNDSGWEITTSDRVHNVDAVVIAVPAEQAAELLKGPAASHSELADSVSSDPCWAVMASFDQRLRAAQDCLRQPSDAIAWAARNSAKPGRSGEECWVIHASAGWSKENLEVESDAIAQLLLKELLVAIGSDPIEPAHLAAHRWRYAFPQTNSEQPAIWDDELAIGICGDYLISPSVEGAWLSGRALAQRLLSRI